MTWIILSGSVVSQSPTEIYRINSVELRDPHVFLTLNVTVDSPFPFPDIQSEVCFGDSTDELVISAAALGLPGFPLFTVDLGLNDLIATGLAAHPLVLGFPPGGHSISGGTLAVGPGNCPSDGCYLDPGHIRWTGAYSNSQSGPCLQVLPGTTSGYSPTIDEPGVPCFTSGLPTLTLDLFGASITLQDIQLGATWVGDPPGSLMNGLLIGFVSETAAAATEIHFDLESTATGGFKIKIDDTRTLSEMLPGGGTNCAAGDDRDLGMDGQTSGWWLYFNFEAERVALSDSSPRFGTLGSGCAGTAGTPQFGAAPGSLPYVGETFTMAMAGMPTGMANAVSGVLGFSMTNWNGLPLPQDLSQLGFVGCTQYVAIDFIMPLVNNNGTAVWNIDVPLDPTLVGLDFFAQGIVLDPGANVGGAVVSNAVSARIGAR